MYIVWRQERGRNKAYAYLRESYWDKATQKPKAKIVYLGNTLEEAKTNLEDYLKSGQVALTGLEQLALLEQLKEKAPAAANAPKRDISLEATIKMLRKRIDAHKDRPEVAAILEKALDDLEKIFGGGGNAKDKAPRTR